MSENVAGAKPEILQIPTSKKENEIPDAVFPTERPRKVSDWKRFIRGSVPGFDGDINSAARILFAYQKGSDYIYNKFQPKFGDFDKPDIMVLLSESKFDSPMGSVDNENKILVKKSYLEKFSNIDEGAWVVIKRADGDTAYVGQPHQVFELAGVEETHHQLFTKIKGSEKGISPNRVTMSEYDSQEVEYRALRWQIQYAVENKFSEDTIQVLRDRLDKAQKIRLGSIK